MRPRLVLWAAGAALCAAPLGLAVPAEATEPYVKACDQDNVDCGEFPAPKEIEPGTPCKILVDGDWLEGETNDQGQCVCEYVPEPTTVPSTEPPTTTVTLPDVTTTEPPPTTETTTTVGETTTSTTVVLPTTELPSFEFESCAEAVAAGAAPVHSGSFGYSSRLDVDGDGVGCETETVDSIDLASRPASSASLPRTGSNNTLMLATVGAGLLALGSGLVSLRRWVVRRA